MFYDDWGNLAATTYSDGTPSVMLTYDALGRRIAKNNETYGYNDRSELVSATGNGVYAYQYDDIGNRCTSSERGETRSYSANQLNQYIGADYDLDGNQTNVTTRTGVWAVTYNGENRPIRWICGATNIVMKFDRLGRRIEYLETNASTRELAVLNILISLPRLGISPRASIHRPKAAPKGPLWVVRAAKQALCGVRPRRRSLAAHTAFSHSFF